MSSSPLTVNDSSQFHLGRIGGFIFQGNGFKGLLSQIIDVFHGYYFSLNI